MRRLIAFAVIALHILLVWLLALGFRSRIDRAPAPPQLVSLWLQPLPVMVEPLPAEPLPPETSRRKKPAEAPPPAAPTTVLIAPTVPEPTPESTAPIVAPAPPVDFARAAGLVARRMAEAEAAAKAKETFSPPPKALARPCVPKERSMKWNGEENPGVHWYGPIPILVTRRCVITLGVFSCAIGELPPPDSHLFDDMKDPDRPRSSVPDPYVCD